MKEKSLCAASSFNGEVGDEENASGIRPVEQKRGEGVDLEKVKKTSKNRGKSKNSAALKKLRPLKIAAENIADMLSSLSGDEELFVVFQDEKPQRRIDTKTLKEFSSVIKEITGVICELNGISDGNGTDGGGGVKIEFDEEAEECSR